MYKYYIIFIILSSSSSCFSANFNFGKAHQIESQVLNENREYWVSLPPSYSDNSNQTYPVVYLLDAEQNYFFHAFSGILRQMSSDASPSIPEVILVGVVNQNRIRDLSPTTSLLQYGGEVNKDLKISGGADLFITFLETELKPKVQQDYRTANYNILAGYSFSGLAVIHTLFTNASYFDSYIAIDPSIWWDNQVLLKRSAGFMSLENSENVRLFVTSSERVGKVYPKENFTIEFINKFEQEKIQGFRFSSKIFGVEENHQTMPILSFYHGMRFIFDGYMIDEETRFRPAIELEQHFAHISEQLGFEMKSSEGLVNWFAQDQMFNNQFGINTQRAIDFLRLNVKWYPNSVKVYINLGDGLMHIGNKQEAMRVYKKGLSLFPGNRTLKDNVNQ